MLSCRAYMAETERPLTEQELKALQQNLARLSEDGVKQTYRQAWEDCLGIPAKLNAGSGIGLKRFGFIAEPVFAFIPESCSRSTRNAVRNHPGIAFTLPRIPQTAG